MAKASLVAQKRVDVLKTKFEAKGDWDSLLRRTIGWMKKDNIHEGPRGSAVLGCSSHVLGHALDLYPSTRGQLHVNCA